jgi:sugar transferase (PEP-CTERM/EpsH1 system associated)
MRIRILHVVDSLGTGGMERGLANVIEGTGQQKFEHMVCAVRALGPLADRIRQCGASVTRLSSGEPSRVQFGDLWRLIRHARPHVVHSRNWGAIEAVFAASLYRKCGVIHSEHGLEARWSAGEPRRRRWLRRLAYEFADHVMAVSSQLGAWHSNATGFPAHRIAVIRNGVDTDRFRANSATRAAMRQQYGLLPEEFCIGTVARLDPVKDIGTLLEAVRQLPPERLRWRLLIAGSGPELPELIRRMEAHAVLKERVRFVGELRDIPGFLNALDAYVLSSLFEGISNSLLEAMASSLPVIVTDVGGNREVVIDGVSGIMFPPQDVGALVKALTTFGEQEEVRARFAEQARRRVEQEFSLERMMQNYDALYTKAAQIR